MKSTNYRQTRLQNDAGAVKKECPVNEGTFSEKTTSNWQYRKLEKYLNWSEVRSLENKKYGDIVPWRKRRTEVQSY